MDAKAKKAAAEKVRRRFTREVAPLGFERTRSTFWTRSADHVIEFVHLHLFTFAPAFRVHFGIRVLNDPFEVPSLNGPMSSDVEAFHFDAEEDAISACARAMAEYCRSVGEPWFQPYQQPESLLRDPSPLKAGERLSLEEALAGRAILERVQASKEQLGVV